MKNIKKLLLLSSLGAIALSTIGLSNANAQVVTDPTTPANVEFNYENADLLLNKIPNPFNFTTQGVNTQVVIPVLNNALDIILSDYRETAGGWDLSATLSNFTLNGDGINHTLEEASITFSGLSANPLNAAIEAVQPTLETITVPSDGVTNDVLAFADRATPNMGVGPWQIIGNVQLDIPQYQASVGQHQATITWLLSDAN